MFASITVQIKEAKIVVGYGPVHRVTRSSQGEELIVGQLPKKRKYPYGDCVRKDKNSRAEPDVAGPVAWWEYLRCCVTGSSIECSNQWWQSSQRVINLLSLVRPEFLACRPV